MRHTKALSYFDCSLEDIESFKLIKNRAYINVGNTEQEMLKNISNTIYEGISNGYLIKDTIQKIENNLISEYKKYAITVARTGAADLGLRQGVLDARTDSQPVGMQHAFPGSHRHPAELLQPWWTVLL